MKSIFSLIVSVPIGTVLLCASASGHGFGLTLADNTILAQSEVPTISPHLFTEQFDSSSSTQVFSDHGGVEADAGFNLPLDKLSVEFLGPLWYSSGGVAFHADTGFTLNATSYDTSVVPNTVLGTLNITGSTANPGSFPVVDDDDHSIGWILSGSSAIPAGVYGFAYRVTGVSGGGSPFDPSVPLVVAFNTPDFSSDLAGAQQAVFNAALQGDFNRDGKLDAGDIQEMLNALTDLNVYQSTHDVLGGDMLAIGDLDRDGSVTNLDTQVLLNLLASNATSLQTVSEPSSVILLMFAIIAFSLHCSILKHRPRFMFDMAMVAENSTY
jgi:hypothetical protein